MTGCAHSTVRLLNPWEPLRKYVCGDCDAIMTFACCVDIAIFVLPHQAGRGVDPDSKPAVARAADRHAPAGSTGAASRGYERARSRPQTDERRDHTPTRQHDFSGSSRARVRSRT